MESAVAYYRVSTKQQQRSGLGIEAQRATVMRFAEGEGLIIVAEFVEIETGKGADALDRRPQLAGRGDQFVELQLQLVEQSLAALRAWPEVLALHLRNRELELLDQRLRAGELRARLDQRCLERFHVIGERIRRARHTRMESQDTAFVTLRPRPDSQCRVQPAAVGRHVCCGIRQSIPSSRYPSCAGVIVTVPSAGDGQMKR